MYVGMVDGIAKNAWVPIVAPRRVTEPARQAVSAVLNGIRASALGRSRRSVLSRPSTRRALTAGALALAVIAPNAESADNPAESGSPPASVSQKAQRPLANPFFSFAPRRAERASRFAAERSNARRALTARRVTTARKAKTRPAARAVRVSTHRSVVGETHKIAAVRAAEPRRRETHVRGGTTTVVRRDSARVHPNRFSTRQRGGMSAVLSYARSQVGKRYVRGGEGPYSFDCSGLTRRAYAYAGLDLPHSSGAQAARARPISAAAARAGDLVVGPGHVGVYMGGGMMIDAGNPGTGVVYRRLYAGLRIERF